jgi:phosphoglycolate phosphatase
MNRRLSALLFDLDGTLVDSAPDLAGAANEMRAARGLAPLPYPTLRPRASSGARGMLAAAFGAAPGDDGYDALRAEFLARYEPRMLAQSALFDAIAQVLDSIDAAGLRWGIVTNKSTRLAESMASALGLLPRAAVLVGGDSTPHAKPHPAPLLEAARRIGAAPGSCVYVGDDPRDIAAGRAAGMAAWAAAWGYLGPGGDPHAWGADAVLERPRHLLQFLDLA